MATSQLEALNRPRRFVVLGPISGPNAISVTSISKTLAPEFERSKWRWSVDGKYRRKSSPNPELIEKTIHALSNIDIKLGKWRSSGGLCVTLHEGTHYLSVDPKLKPLAPDAPRPQLAGQDAWDEISRNLDAFNLAHSRTRRDA